MAEAEEQQGLNLEQPEGQDFTDPLGGMAWTDIADEACGIKDGIYSALEERQPLVTLETKRSSEAIAEVFIWLEGVCTELKVLECSNDGEFVKRKLQEALDLADTVLSSSLDPIGTYIDHGAWRDFLNRYEDFRKFLEGKSVSVEDFRNISHFFQIACGNLFMAYRQSVLIEGKLPKPARTSIFS